MEAQDRKAMYDLVEKEGKLDAWLKYRQQEVHADLKNAKIVGGFQRENQAVLLVTGTGVKGQVALSKENGKWKIADELYQTGSD